MTEQKRDNYKLYCLLKDKGIKESDIQELLDVTVSLDDYFKPLTQRFAALESILAGNTFRYFVLKDLENSKQIKQLFLSKATYPIVLFLTVVLAAYFFDQTMIPLITDSILLWSTQDQSLFIFQLFLRFFWSGSLVLIVLLMLLLVRLQNKRFFIRFYKTLFRLFKKNIIAQYYSKEFARYYLVLYESGCNTSEILNSLKEQNIAFVVGNLALEMDRELSNGKEIRKVIEELPIEKTLIKMFLMGLTTGETEQLLRQYVEVGQLLFEHRVDQLTKTLQAIMYTIASLLIAVLYRLLMAPLSVIGQI